MESERRRIYRRKGSDPPDGRRTCGDGGRDVDGDNGGEGMGDALGFRGGHCDGTVAGPHHGDAASMRPAGEMAGGGSALLRGDIMAAGGRR
jgi:hypothetical protein